MRFPPSPLATSSNQRPKNENHTIGILNKVSLCRSLVHLFRAHILFLFRFSSWWVMIIVTLYVLKNTCDKSGKLESKGRKTPTSLSSNMEGTTKSVWSIPRVLQWSSNVFRFLLKSSSSSTCEWPSARATRMLDPLFQWLFGIQFLGNSAKNLNCHLPHSFAQFHLATSA